MIFCKNKRYPGFILIFTLFSLALLSMIFIYRLEDRTHREKFYSLAMKAGGFLDVKKNGKDLEVDVRGLLDLERWSMLNYLRACFYNLATDPRTYMWYLEDNPYKGITDDSVILFLFTRYGTGFCAGTKTDKYYYHHFLGRYKNACTFEKMKFEEIENVVKRYLLWPLPMNYSGAVKSAKSVKTGGIVHNSHLKVEAKIGLADNKLPFNKKFKKEALNALYECIETAYPYKDYKGIVNEGAKKNLGSWKINGITYFNDKAAEIMNQVGNLIEDYEKKCPGYTLTFSDLMSISELRLLIQGNFEDEVLQECKWAKDNFKEENAKKLEALIRDTFVFHDIYAVNFLLANKFVQDAFIKVNIPVGFLDNSPTFMGHYKSVDHRLKNIGRNKQEEKDTTGLYIVTDTADSMYSFDGVESLSEADLVGFLGQEFYKDYTGGPNSKFKEKISVPTTTLGLLNNNQLEILYAGIFGVNQPNINSPKKRNEALDDIEKGIRNGIRNLLKAVLRDRRDLYYGSNGYGVRKVIKFDSGPGFLKDGKQFSEAFDYLAFEGETGRLAELKDMELKLVCGRDNNKPVNGIINTCIEDDDGIMNLQILKILCKKLSVFCAKDENDKKLYLFPYPWDDRLSDEWNEKNKLQKYDVGSICDISNNGVEHTTYYYDYLGDYGNFYDSKSRLEYEFDKKHGIMVPILSKHAKVYKDHKHSLLLKEDVFTDGELGSEKKGIHSGNPWDRVRNFCSFSNYANVKLRIYDDRLKFIRKETDDVICFEIPNDLKLKRFTENSGVVYMKSLDGTDKIYFKPNGGFHIEPIPKSTLDKKH